MCGEKPAVDLLIGEASYVGKLLTITWTVIKNSDDKNGIATFEWFYKSLSICWFRDDRLRKSFSMTPVSMVFFFFLFFPLGIRYKFKLLFILLLDPKIVIDLYADVLSPEATSQAGESYPLGRLTSTTGGMAVHSTAFSLAVGGKAVSSTVF